MTYDLEASGLEQRYDQPVQFAAAWLDDNFARPHSLILPTITAPRRPFSKSFSLLRFFGFSPGLQPVKAVRLFRAILGPNSVLNVLI